MGYSTPRQSCGNATNAKYVQLVTSEESVRAAKLDDLTAKLDKLLARGIQEDALGKAYRPDDTIGHGQFETIFGFYKELATVKAQLQKQEAPATDSKQITLYSQAPALARSNSMVTNMCTAAQQEQNRKNEDLLIRNQKLEVSIKELQERNDMLLARVQALESKERESETRFSKSNKSTTSKFQGVQQTFRFLKDRVDKLERQIRQPDGEFPPHPFVEHIEEDVQNHANRISELEDEVYGRGW